MRGFASHGASKSKFYWLCSKDSFLNVIFETAQSHFRETEQGWWKSRVLASWALRNSLFQFELSVCLDRPKKMARFWHDFGTVFSFWCCIWEKGSARSSKQTISCIEFIVQSVFQNGETKNLGTKMARIAHARNNLVEIIIKISSFFSFF